MRWGWVLGILAGVALLWALFGPWPAFGQPRAPPCLSEAEWAFKAGFEAASRNPPFPIKFERFTGPSAQRLMNEIARLAKRPPIILDALLVISGSGSYGVAVVRGGRVCLMIPMRRELYDRALRNTLGEAA